MVIEEITAVYVAERFRFDGSDGDTVIGDANLITGGQLAGVTFKVKGKAELNELMPHQSYRFFGRWTEYKNRRTGATEKQFAFDTFVRDKPFGRTGIISYLRNAGEGNGIGSARAAKLWELYGSDAVRMLREHPEEVSSKIKGLTLTDAQSAANWLTQEQSLEGCTIDLSNLLAGRGFPKTIVRRAVKEWGNRAAEVIQRDPYMLMNFRGCGFKRCDNLWLELGLPRDKLRRQAFSAWYAVSVESERNGHTWVPLNLVVRELHRTIGHGVRAAAALKMAKRIGKIAADRHGALAVMRSDGNVIVRQDGSIWLAEGRKANAEDTLARLIVDSKSEICSWPDPSEIVGISDHQRETLLSVLRGMIVILGGGPGTGKTYTAAATMRSLALMYGAGNIAVGAPTGKAAVRITEAMQAAGLPFKARTWHSLLKVGEIDELTGTWGFQYHAGNPWPYKVLVGDESSMLDTSLMSSIFLARPAGCHFILVGDVNQLPPVGHGAPLRDLIAAGLPYGELREIKRNSGGIVEACKAIREETRWSPGDNLRMAEIHGEDRQLDALKQALAEVRSDGLDPVWDAQVVVAVNAKSKLSRKAVNEFLQDLLNERPKTNGQVFRVGDKIVNGKNGFFPVVEVGQDEEAQLNDQGEVYVANGELAAVLEVEEKYVVAKLSNPRRTIKIPKGKAKQRGNEDDESDDDDKEQSTGCSWSLGYALSVHKCVHPNTLVETPAGLMPIRKLLPTGRIGTPCGVHKYTERFYYEYAPCLAITTKDGQEITVTVDHRCERWNGTEYELVEAGALRIGDFVRTALFPAAEPTTNAILPPGPVTDCRAKDVSVPTVMTPELAEFLGLCVADGVIFHGGVRLGKRHAEVAQRFTQLCAELFGTTNREFPTSGMLVSECCSSVVRDWLYAVGGCYPKAKFVPECILESTLPIHRAFLRGLFEDGTVNLAGQQVDHIEWSTCFPRLLVEVRAMLARLGFISGRNSQKTGRGLLYLYGQEAVRFGREIGFISQFKQHRLQFSAGEQTRYVVPVSRDFLDRHRQFFGKWSRQNGRSRGYLSRRDLQYAAERGCAEAMELLRWHHSRIRSINATSGPVMCVEVPGCGRFMQNGFPWGNSQGSEWPVVIVMIDEYPGARKICDRAWIYTAISRAKSRCVLIGKRATIDRFCRVQSMNGRKTFLRQLIHLKSAERVLVEL